MKTKVNDLTDAQLDELCARAQGWSVKYGDLLDKEDSVAVWCTPAGLFGEVVAEYHPTSNDAQAMGLVKEFKLLVGYNSVMAWWYVEADRGGYSSDDNLNRAICKAVVASVFGDEVEVTQ